jgi:hypothetical protein
MLFSLVFVVGELKPEFIVVLEGKQLLLPESGLREVIVVYEEVDVEIVDDDEAQ